MYIYVQIYLKVEERHNLVPYNLRIDINVTIWLFTTQWYGATSEHCTAIIAAFVLSSLRMQHLYNTTEGCDSHNISQLTPIDSNCLC